MYFLFYSKQAEKQIKKLEQGTRERIISTLERIRIRPHQFVKRLVGSPYFRLRSGKYRIILDIQDDKLIVFVIEVEDRKKIYKQ